MPRKTKKALLVGGFNFKTGNSKPITVSKTAPVDSRSESDYMVGIFDFLKLHTPRPPYTQRRSERAKRIVLDEDRTDEKYLNHPLYILTKFRHFPNGGERHGAVAKQLFREGVKAGAFDLYLDASRHGFAGLRIELKAHDNDLSDVQIEEKRWLIKENYCTHVCWHYIEVLHILAWYTGINLMRLSGFPSRHAYKLPEYGHDEKCGCDMKLNLK